jgi:Family of unknown function (DUF6307)
LIQVEQVESVEFVGGFNERGGTEMRVAKLSLAYRGAAQRRIRPEAERGWAGFVSCAMSLSWAKTISAGGPSTGKLATSSAFPLSERTRLNRKKTVKSGSTFRSPYEKRLKLVQETLRKYSSLDDAAAGELAVHVLHALDSIPEKIR